MIQENYLLEILKDQIKTLKEKPKGMLREGLQSVSIIPNFAGIISGVRRCGKSTLLYQLLYKNELNALYVNFDDPRLFDFQLTDFQKLDNIINNSGQRTLMFDEIQIIKGWERYVRQKLDANYNVYVTGSNASLLSKELGSSLTGRHISTELFPFSFSEYCEFESLEKNPDSSIKFMKEGGFPEFVKHKKPEILRHLLNDILVRDIAVRFNIKDERSLIRLSNYLLSNVGNLTSANKLKEPTGLKSTTTILEYMSHLENAYLFNFVPIFDHSLKKQAVNPKKIYAIDTGLVSANISKSKSDKGHLLENMVYNALRRETSELFYHKGKGECDFLVVNMGEVTKAIQVCFDLNPDNQQREFNGLIDALNAYDLEEGYIITHSIEDVFKVDQKTIKVIPVHKFI